MPPAVISNDRIAGTRITVYDVFYYREAGRDAEEIAQILGLSSEQVHVALEYIRQHEAEVRVVHQQIEERNARGNPPEVQAKLAASQAKMQAWLNERRKAQSQEGNGEGTSGRR